MLGSGKVYIFDGKRSIRFNRKRCIVYGIYVDEENAISSPIVLGNDSNSLSFSIYEEIYEMMREGIAAVIDASDIQILEPSEDLIKANINSYSEADETEIVSMINAAADNDGIVMSMDHSYMDMIDHGSFPDYSFTDITIKMEREWRKYRFLGNFDSPLSIRAYAYSRIGSQLATIMYRARNLRDREAEEYARRIVETSMPIIITPSTRGAVKTLPRFEELADAMWFYAKHLEPMITELYDASENLSKELRKDIRVLFETYQKYMRSQLKVKWIEDQIKLIEDGKKKKKEKERRIKIEEEKTEEKNENEEKEEKKDEKKKKLKID
jgi:hypothetical protein